MEETETKVGKKMEVGEKVENEEKVSEINKAKLELAGKVIDELADTLKPHRVENGGPVWYLYATVTLDRKEETVLAQNGVDYAHHPKVTNGNEVNYKIPIYPEDVKRFNEYMYVQNNNVYLYNIGEKLGVRYSKDWKTGQIDFNPKGYADEAKVSAPEGVCVSCCNESVEIGLDCLRSVIRDAIREKKGIITDEEARAVLIEMLQRYDEFVKKLPELKEKLRKEIREDFEKKYKERKKAEEECKAAEEEEKRKKMETLLSKQWIKQLKEKIDIESARMQEIERFKKTYELTDEELQMNETYKRPYVRITAKIDLRPLGIDRTLYIRNYIPDHWLDTDNMGESVFSDYAQEVARTLAEILGYEVLVFDDQEDDECRYNAYLAVVKEDNYDTIEVASQEIDDCY